MHPTLKLEELVGVMQEFDHGRQFFWYMAVGILTVTVIVLLLSAAGIYAMMSFTVAKAAVSARRSARTRDAC